MMKEQDCGWLVVESVCEDGRDGTLHNFVSVVPNYGPEHVPSPDCWCYPELNIDNVLQHNVMH